LVALKKVEEVEEVEVVEEKKKAVS